MTTFISKETITRLLKDVKHIIKNPLTDQGIYYIHDDTDMLKGYALIIGPSDTPYFGGNYFFEFIYPTDYPHSPPKVRYCTNGNKIRFNPNLYTCGKVCVSLLNTWKGDQWTSCQSISTVLLTLCTLLCKDPLLNEPGVGSDHQDMIHYNEIIEYSNLSIACCDIIFRKDGVYLPFFENFYPFVKENFLKNIDQMIVFAHKKNDHFKGQEFNFRTGYYSMNINVNYLLVIERLNEAKFLLSS
jgi:ubiquitin-conjugating enzyme E2 Z